RTSADDVLRMYIGLNERDPFIRVAVAAMAGDGLPQAVSIVLAPNYSTFNIDDYHGRATEAAKQHGISLSSVIDWYDAPGFIHYWADQITKTYEKMSEQERARAVLIV